MNTLLVATAEEPKVWAGLLAAALPGHRILTTPPPRGTPVAYVAVGKPPPGLIASLTGLEVVLSVNAGIEPLLAPGMVADGIPIVRMVDPGLTEGMVEWVLAQVLAWHRNLSVYEANQADGLWTPIPERLARERTVTVLGAGALGAAVAGALIAVGFKVRIWSRTFRDIPGAVAFAGVGQLGEAASGADVVVCLLPLTPGTEGILNAGLFERMAPGAFVINAGRGGHLIDDELIAALDGGQLSGAALDVFRQEPPPSDHPFWTHPRVRVSPHVAAQTHARTAAAVLAETVQRWERGEPLENLVDRLRGY